MNELEWQLLEEKRLVDSVCVNGVPLKNGHHVILRPRKGGDIFDLALTGQEAIIEAIEQDYEGKLHLAVVLDDDPGKDLGVLRQPGHRFFFTPEEVEPCAPSVQQGTRASQQPRILVAGIGNIFLGDDAFGVEVIRRLALHTFPQNVDVHDFGIRGYDLAYALIAGYDLTILVDACSRGEAPGTVYVIEPALNDANQQAPAALDAHTMNPINVLRAAKAMGSLSSQILLVACEPESLGGDEGHIGLSQPVSNAVNEAVKLVEKLITDALQMQPPGEKHHGN
jgi:hydrogenase maturation protease